MGRLGLGILGFGILGFGILGLGILGLGIIVLGILILGILISGILVLGVLGLGRLGLGRMSVGPALSRVTTAVAGAQGSASVLRARIEVTVDNRQVSGVITVVKMTTYERGAAKTGAAVEAARERRAM